MDVKGPGGSFALDLWMGKLTAELASEAAWRARGPEWARDLWPVLHEELAEWCKKNGAGLEVAETASVYLP